MTDTIPTLHATGPEHHLAGAILTIDLDRLKTNYRIVAERSLPAEAAAVVKADAYGLGIAQVVPALLAAGCRRFFVAQPHEGIAARAHAPDADIYVLSPLLGAEQTATLKQHRLIPVLNTPTDITIWEAEGWSDGRALPCALHVDTGMNRLGLSLAEAESFARDNALTGALDVALVMSHLACADDPAHPLNARQCEAFQRVRGLFAGIEASLANSAGIGLGGDFLCDLTRAGIALYGGRAGPGTPLQAVATLEARILQIRTVRAGETVGYGATVKLDRDTVLAVVSCGYADGYHRAISGSGVAMRRATPLGGFGFAAGRRVPVVGRISMDLTCFDITDIEPDTLGRGDLIELFGPNLSIEDAAAAAGTIGYELLTSLGQRYHRVYVGGATT